MILYIIYNRNIIQYFRNSGTRYIYTYTGCITPDTSYYTTAVVPHFVFSHLESYLDYTSPLSFLSLLLFLLFLLFLFFLFFLGLFLSRNSPGGLCTVCRVCVCPVFRTQYAWHAVGFFRVSYLLCPAVCGHSRADISLVRTKN